MTRSLWAGPALFALLAACSGCGGSSDASKEASAAPIIQAKNDQIERFKAQSRHPARAARPASGRSFQR